MSPNSCVPPRFLLPTVRQRSYLGQGAAAPHEGDARLDETQMTQTDDARRRTVLIATVAFVAVLLAGAVWLAGVISDNRKLDRCLSSGRKTCVELPQGERGVARPAF